MKLAFTTFTTNLLIASFLIYQFVMMGNLSVMAICNCIAWGMVYLILRYLQTLYPQISHRIVGAIILWGTVQSVIAILQIANVIPSNHPLFAATGSFANPGPLGGYLAICFILAVSASGIKKVREKKLLHRFILASIVLTGTGCFLSDSRAAWIAVFITLGYMVIKRLSPSQKVKVYVVPPCLLFVGIYFLYAYRPASANGRLLIWKVCMRMIAEHPVFGHGSGTFASQYMLYQADYFEQANFLPEETILASDNIHAFNEVLRITCEYGFFGLLLCIVIGILLVATIKQANQVQRCAFMALVTYTIFACFSYPAEVFMLKMTGAILLAIAVPISEQEKRQIRKAGVIICTLSLGILLFTVKEFYTESHTKKILLHYNATEDEESERQLHKMLSHSKNNEHLMSLYAKILFEKGLYEECIPVLQHSVELIPTGEKLLDLGLSYQYTGKSHKAIHCFRKASHMLPGHIMPVYHLFSIYKDSGNSLDSTAWYAHRLTDMRIKKETERTLLIRQEAASYLKVIH